MMIIDIDEAIIRLRYLFHIDQKKNASPNSSIYDPEKKFFNITSKDGSRDYVLRSLQKWNTEYSIANYRIMMDNIRIMGSGFYLKQVM